MLFGRKRLEEDLERIRRANLPEEKLILEDEEKAELEQKVKNLDLEKGDIPAMIIAAFTVIVPYVLIIIAAILVVYFVYMFIAGVL